MDDLRRLNRQILIETVGSVLWFLMDGFWMLNLPVVAKAMALPTIAVNVLVFRYASRSVTQYAVVAAMNSWLLMNVFWMFGDLDKDEGNLVAARFLFFAGVALLAVAAARGASNPERLTKVLTHFRRLRT